MTTTCEWCKDENAEDASEPEKLCRMHQAEYEGVSLYELDRMDAEQAFELREWAS